ncbi:unnamed protein product, partial [marine sediment metagenome]
VVVGGLVYSILKRQGTFGAQAVIGQEETPFWAKLLGAGAEQYRSGAFDPGEFIRDVTWQ